MSCVPTSGVVGFADVLPVVMRRVPDRVWVVTDESPLPIRMRITPVPVVEPVAEETEDPFAIDAERWDGLS